MLKEQRQYNPPHPGEILQENYIEESGITASELAGRIGVHRSLLDDVLNKDRAITPYMALRLSVVLGTSEKLWLNLQHSWDLWHEKEKHRAEFQLSQQDVYERKKGVNLQSSVWDNPP